MKKGEGKTRKPKYLKDKDKKLQTTPKLEREKRLKNYKKDMNSKRVQITMDKDRGISTSIKKRIKTEKSSSR